MKQKTVIVKSSKAIETQRILELNQFKILSWTVLSGRKVAIVYALLFLALILGGAHAHAETIEDKVLDLAKSNGFTPSKRIVNAIVNASDEYDVDALELTAIGIVETGLGKYAKTRKNRNGTFDKGLFQINTINERTCIEYNLDSAEGSALCAAKLLSSIKMKHKDYLGRYHSKTPSKKVLYSKKITKVLALVSDR